MVFLQLACASLDQVLAELEGPEGPLLGKRVCVGRELFLGRSLPQQELFSYLAHEVFLRLVVWHFFDV